MYITFLGQILNFHGKDFTSTAIVYEKSHFLHKVPLHVFICALLV